VVPVVVMVCLSVVCPPRRRGASRCRFVARTPDNDWHLDAEGREG